jgi:hypothetical protein
MDQFILDDNPSVPKDLYSEILAYLENCEAPFQPSQLYDSNLDEKFIDEERRLSEFREIRDAKFFDTLQKALVDVLNEDQRQNNNDENDTNKKNSNLEFTLVRNDAMHIRYKTGGFFKSHSDFLSLTSNMVQEYTLILCVTPPELANQTRGGETIITTSSKRKQHTSKSTIAPGNFLVFRKDLEHEGAILTEGEKHILTLNLWCTSRGNNNTTTGGDPTEENDNSNSWNDGVLLVSFPNESKQSLKRAKTETNKKEKEELLRELSNQDQSKTYAIPISKIKQQFPKSLLAEYVDLQKEQATGSSNSSSNGIIQFECSGNNFKFEAFAPIYRMFLGMYVSPQEVSDSKSLMDYFGIPASSVLMGFISLEDSLPLENNNEKTIIGKEEGSAATTTTTTSSTSNAPVPPKKVLPGDKDQDVDYFFVGNGEDVWGDDDYEDMESDELESKVIGFEDLKNMSEMPGDLDSRLDKVFENGPDVEEENSNIDDEDIDKNDVIVCSTPYRTQVVASLARKLRLPYVPFRVILVEGALQFGGGMIDVPAMHITMRPVWASIGSYDNILFVQQLLERYSGRQGRSLGNPEELAKLRFREVSEHSADFPRHLSEPNKQWDLHDNLNTYELMEYHRGVLSMRLRCALDLGNGSDNENGKELPPSWQGIRHNIMRLVLFGQSTDSLLMTTLPENVSTSSSSDSDNGGGATGGNDASSPTHCPTIWPFHYDSSGKSCFSLQEAEKATNKLQSMKFLEKVQAAIHTTNFDFAQVRTAGEESFCNESVYAKLVLLEVTGVVKLEEKANA